MHGQNLAVVKGLVSVAWADGRVSSEETEVLEALLEAFEAMPSEAHELRRFATTPRSLADVPLAELGFAARRQLLEKLVELLEIPALEARDLVRESEERAKSLVKLL